MVTVYAGPSAEKAVRGIAPDYKFREVDQTAPAGMWRIQLTGDDLEFQDATASDWSTYNTPVKLTSTPSIVISGDIEFTGNLDLADDALLLFGSGDDMYMGYSATDDALEIGTGSTITANIAIKLSSAGVLDLTMGGGGIANAGQVALDSITAADTDINVAVTDDSATAFTVKQGSDSYLIVDTANSSESVEIGTGVAGTEISLGTATSAVTVNNKLNVTGSLDVTGNIDMMGAGAINNVGDSGSDWDANNLMLDKECEFQTNADSWLKQSANGTSPHAAEVIGTTGVVSNATDTGIVNLTIDNQPQVAVLYVHFLTNSTAADRVESGLIVMTFGRASNADTQWKIDNNEANMPYSQGDNITGSETITVTADATITSGSSSEEQVVQMRINSDNSNGVSAITHYRANLTSSYSQEPNDQIFITMAPA